MEIDIEKNKNEKGKDPSCEENKNSKSEVKAMKAELKNEGVSVVKDKVQGVVENKENKLKKVVKNKAQKKEGATESESKIENERIESRGETEVVEVKAEGISDETEMFEGELSRTEEKAEEKFVHLEEEVKRLEEELKKAKEEAEEYKRKWIYTFSDFENYRRRVVREIDDEIKRFAINVFSNFISCVDSIESAMQFINDESVKKGVELIKKMIFDALFKSGVTEIEVKEGDDFSPEKCEALGYEETDKMEEGKILRVIRRGFEYGGKLIRPAQVVLAKRKKDEEKQKEIEKKDLEETNGKSQHNNHPVEVK